MTFSEKLRLLIEENDLTQKGLANELHIPVSTFGGYVQGTSEPDFQTLVMIAKYFGVSADYLLGSFTDDVKADGAENDREAELLRVFRQLQSSDRELFLEQGKTILKFRKGKYKSRHTALSLVLRTENHRKILSVKSRRPEHGGALVGLANFLYINLYIKPL